MGLRRILISSLAGAGVGYFALHPYTMLAFGITEKYGLHAGRDWSGHIVGHLREVVAAFDPGMLHMGIPYAVLGAATGGFFGFWRETERQRVETEKRALAVEALVSAIDAKSHWTKGHSENVKDYAVMIATRMGLGQAETGNLRLAALLHDIGKIGTYDTLLEKHGKLTDKEFTIVKRHPEAGANILKPIEQLKDIIPVILHHHERWDGLGYPDGLKGPEIPALARVVCVADAYDAMTADRPYKPSMGDEYAINELKRWKGIKFAPEVVDAFLEILKEKNEAA